MFVKLTGKHKQIFESKERLLNFRGFVSQLSDANDFHEMLREYYELFFNYFPLKIILTENYEN